MEDLLDRFVRRTGAPGPGPSSPVTAMRSRPRVSPAAVNLSPVALKSRLVPPFCFGFIRAATRHVRTPSFIRDSTPAASR